jgi:ferredoxin
MAYTISDECISCGACESECPFEAISEGSTQFVIDADVCQDGGACAEACPQSAISS